MLLAQALLFPGCSLLSSDDLTLTLETDRAAYELPTTDVIEVEVENTSSAVIYFSTCMPTTLEELAEGRVVATLSFPVCECICPAELEPDEKWGYRVSLAWIEEHEDQLQLQEDDTYRLRLAFFRDREMRQLLNEGTLYTNRFKLSQ